LASQYGFKIPESPLQRKGWLGQMLEVVLGTSAGTMAAPDFLQLGIELKSIPLSATGLPKESTFVTTIPLLTVHKESWKTSACYAKLRRVLWVPVEGDPTIAYATRRIGQAVLWSPSAEEDAILQQDWEELTELIVAGKLTTLDATYGQYLQIRPKAADAASLCDAFDEAGHKIKTLPRGLYLRSQFTGMVIHRQYAL